VAQQPADAVVAGNANTGQARVFIQQMLDDMDTGISIQTVSIQGDPSMPGPVQDAYQAVTTAQNEKERQIEAARNERERILVGAAGAAAMPDETGGAAPLLKLIDQYQMAVRADETEKAKRLKTQLAESYRTLRVEAPDGGTRRIGGEAASVISQARGYADEIEQKLRSERNTFLKLHEQYQKNPRILISRIWQEARETIFTGNGVETMYSMQGRPYIVVNSDPSVQQKREQDQAQAAEGQNAGGGG
jgi:regulator of protease activity HflC (stomatin/prohibitin superfamily)